MSVTDQSEFVGLNPHEDGVCVWGDGEGRSRIVDKRKTFLKSPAKILER